MYEDATGLISIYSQWTKRFHNVADEVCSIICPVRQSWCIVHRFAMRTHCVSFAALY